MGKFSMTVVTDDNKIFRQGYSKEGHLGVNENYGKMTQLEKIDEEE